MEWNNNNIVIYQTDDGMTKIDVKLENETACLSQQQMAELFSTIESDKEIDWQCYWNEKKNNNPNYIRYSFYENNVKYIQKKMKLYI